MFDKNMDSARWERIQTLFHEAAERPLNKRAAYLADDCEGDDSLAAEVLAMLDEDARGASLLDQEVAEIAGRGEGGEDVPAADWGLPGSKDVGRGRHGRGVPGTARGSGESGGDQNFAGCVDVAGAAGAL